MSCGSLLRLFQSEYFDAHLHMHYLHHMEQPGVQDYLVNELYKMTDDDIDFYLPQLCQIALLRYQKSSLHRFLLDKAAQSMHFALKIHWLVQSVVEDAQPELWESALAMVNMCETAMVNSSGSKATGASRTPKAGSRQPAGVLRTRSTSNPDLLHAYASRPDEKADKQASHSSSRRPRSTEPPSPGHRHEQSQEVHRQASHEAPPEEDDADAEAASPSGASAPSAPSAPSSPGRRGAALRHLTALSQAWTAEEKAQALGWTSPLPNAFLELGEPVASSLAWASDEDSMEADMRQFMMKRRRCDYFNTQNHLVSIIMKLSNSLAAIPEKPDRYQCLRSIFGVINRWLFDRRMFMTFCSEGHLSLLGLHIPMVRELDGRRQILHLHVDHCKIFASATRAPFLLVYERADLDEDAAAHDGDDSEAVEGGHGETSPALGPLAACVSAELDLAGVAMSGEWGEPAGGETGAAALSSLWARICRISTDEWKGIRAKAPEPEPAQDRSRPSPRPSPRPEPSPRTDAEDEATRAKDAVSPEGQIDDATRGGASQRSAASRRAEQALKTRQLIWGEPWEERVERVRQVSPFRHYRSWQLDAVLVKGGDDLRQELLASQIIEQFGAIWKEAGLPLWAKATHTLVSSSSSGFIEFIHNSNSVDAIKRLFPNKSLAEIFKMAFADKLFEAKQNFIESCAAYSLVVWFLQVKDRHNGNLMMTSSGHVIHIDFGFMLSNSPGGNMGFEQSPFKLTQEFLDVMEGECSEQYEYFRTLVIRGFLEARKHRERIILQVRMMLTGSKLPCFREGANYVLETLQDRFFVNLTEEACIEKIVDLIDTSVNNWRTIQYDNYQRLVNGIL